MRKKLEYYAQSYLGIGSITFTNPKEVQDVVKKDNELEVEGQPEHGTHKLDIVKDSSTKKEYVRKQPRGISELEKELMMCNFLHTTNENHPECMLGQNKDGSVSVLSSKRENTQDVEQFIRKGRTPELKTKKVVGLADTLIADNILAKQSDTKYANMLVTDVKTPEGEDILVFSNIDHERANYPTSSIFNSGESRYPANAGELVRGIHDLYPPSDDNRSGLAGDPRAIEFGETAKNVIKNEEIQEAYQKIADANTNLLETQCSNLEENSILFGGRNSCGAYLRFFKEIQIKSGKVAQNLKTSGNDSPASDLSRSLASSTEDLKKSGGTEFDNVAENINTESDNTSSDNTDNVVENINTESGNTSSDNTNNVVENINTESGNTSSDNTSSDEESKEDFEYYIKIFSI